MEKEDFCCQCGEETGFKEGYRIWESIDGKYGHEWCVEKYDANVRKEKGMENVGKDNWHKGYKETKNVIHNEMGITKEAIKDIFRDIAKEEIKDLVLNNKPFLKEVMREVIQEEMFASVKEHRYPKIQGNMHIYTQKGGDADFKDYVSGVMKEEIVRNLAKQFTLNIDITKND